MPALQQKKSNPSSIVGRIVRGVSLLSLVLPKIIFLREVLFILATQRFSSETPISRRSLLKSLAVCRITGGFCPFAEMLVLQLVF